MRRSSFLKLTTALFTGPALLVSNAFAADAGTYRPGTAYHSITANAPDICELQCSGDAQCRSWNFIRLSERSDGVCEFNENLSSPVPSAYSISGNNVSRARSASVIAGQTNTVRVGSPSVTQARTPAKPRPPRPQRHVISQPIPNQTSPQLASYRAPASPTYRPQPTVQQRPYTARPVHSPRQAYAPTNQGPAPRSSHFQHSLEEGPRAAPTPARQNPIVQNTQHASQTNTNTPAAFAHADPRLQNKILQQRQASAASNTSQNFSPPVQRTYAPALSQPAPPNYAEAGGGLSAPPGVPPLSPQTQSLGGSSYSSPLMAGAPPTAPRRVHIPSELSPRPMSSGDSLFGSLYDDVKVPRLLDPALAADSEAPIPTVSSVPTSQINSAPLPPVR